MTVSLQILSRPAGLKTSADELLRFTRRAQKAVGLSGTVGVRVDSNERIRAMNRYFRHIDKATDVLSFPAIIQVGQGRTGQVGQSHTGDIAISAEIAAVNAAAFGHSAADEIKILILHGLLHLAGYDHETDSGTMARIERRLRAQLRLPASLIERSEEGTGKRRASARKPARIKRRKSLAAREGNLTHDKNSIK